MERADFSVLVDIAEKDVGLVPRVLPSWLALGAADVVLAVDEPASGALRVAIEAASGGNPAVRILEVPEDRSWGFRMALVRRRGLKAARFDRILTGDIDIVVNSQCLKALRIVGEDDVGMACLEKRRGGGTVGEVVRNVSKKVVKVVRRRPFFTGLYALYRPYWLDSEVEEEAMSVPSPYAGGQEFLGEDVMMRNAVRRRHKVVYLPVVGGTDVTISFEDRPSIQRKLGARYFTEGVGLAYVLTRSLMYARGTVLGTYLRLAASRDGGARTAARAFAYPASVVAAAERGALRRVALGGRSRTRRP